MKKEGCHQLLEDLGNSDCACFRLRSMFCGGILDTNLLGKTDFEKKQTTEEYQRWEYYWDDKQNKCILVLDNEGIIYNITFLVWLERRADNPKGANNVYGWYYTQCCSKEIEDKIVDEIESCLHKPINKSADTFLAQYVKYFDLRHSPETADFDDAYLLCSYMDYLLATKPAIARLLSILMVRHLETISNPLAQFNLPFLCGRLGLYPECIHTIKHLFHDYKELPSPCLCTIGIVATDNLRKHQFALHCFLESIKLEPTLQPPRQGIWTAGTRCMLEHFVEKDFPAAVNLAEKVIAVGGHEYASHGFYYYLGLAFEILKRNEDALRAYETSLSIRPDFQLSEQGCQRMKKTSPPFLSAQVHMNLLLESSAYDDYTFEDKYPWC